MRKSKRMTMVDKFVENPLFTVGMSLPIIIGGAVSLKNSVILGSFIVYANILTSIIIIYFLKNKSKSVQRLCSVFIAAIAYIPFCWFMVEYFFDAFDAVGIYLPIVVVSSVVKYKINDKYKDSSGYTKLKKTFGISFRYAVSLCLIGSMREILSAGTIWGKKITNVIAIPNACYPYFGFILVGLLIAGGRYIYFKKKGDVVDDNII